MTQLTNTIRFMHVNSDFGTRMTIAYHRDAFGVSFAWTEVFHKDKYVKSEGRRVSTARLMENLEQISGTYTFINDAKYGYITAEDLIRPLTNFLSDSLTMNMTAMDFKHATISQGVYSLILDYKNADVY